MYFCTAIWMPFGAGDFLATFAPLPLPIFDRERERERERERWDRSLEVGFRSIVVIHCSWPVAVAKWRPNEVTLWPCVSVCVLGGPGRGYFTGEVIRQRKFAVATVSRPGPLIITTDSNCERETKGQFESPYFMLCVLDHKKKSDVQLWFIVHGGGVRLHYTRGGGKRRKRRKRGKGRSCISAPVCPLLVRLSLFLSRTS